MITVNVSGLKNNPSAALRSAKDDMVLVMNRDTPDALMIGVNQVKALDMLGVRTAIATALFRGGDLPLVCAANLANMALGGFIKHVSRLGIPVITQTDDEVEADMDTLDEWLES